MNKEEVIARPYEEYYEMIKDMSKDNMIQGLYDLSKECIKKENYINQLETNWNELKGWLKANDTHYAEAIPFRETLRKMQELEGGSNE